MKSRLRAAGLYSDDLEKAGGAHLYVYINVAGAKAFNISVSYKKLVFDRFGDSGFAATWVTGSTGTPGGDTDYIVSSLSLLLDEFLEAYLRVNETACEAR